MKRRLSFGLALGTLLAAGVHGQPVNEYEMKAAYLYNLAKFVEWPSKSFKSDRDPINICVFGQAPLLRALEEVVNGEKIEERQLLVHRISDLQQAGNCHILFVASSDPKNLRAVLRDIDPGILTVGDAAGFAEDGGVANFSMQGNKVRVEINVTAAHRQKLRISPKLLSLAQIVKQ